LKQESSENKCPSASSITPSKQGSSENKCPSFLEGFFSREIITCMEKKIATIAHTIAHKPCQWPKEKQRSLASHNHHQIKLVASCAIQAYVASKSKKIFLSLSLSLSLSPPKPGLYFYNNITSRIV